MRHRSARPTPTIQPHLGAGLLFAALGALLVASASCGTSTVNAQSQSVAAITNTSRDTTQINDFMRFSYVSSATSVTSLARPGALRAFMTATSFFSRHFPLVKR